MSVDSRHYLIYGYNLTGMDTDKFEDWKWSDEGEEYTSDQIPGKVQIFYDPMSGCHLYLGHIFASVCAFEGDSVKINDDDIATAKATVPGHLRYLQEIGVITKDPHFNPKLEMILFEECT